jgi:hypothetical protein
MIEIKLWRTWGEIEWQLCNIAQETAREAQFTKKIYCVQI